MLILTNKYKPKISMRELENTKISDVMKSRGLSEHAFQQEVRKHCGDSKQHEQRKILERICENNRHK